MANICLILGKSGTGKSSSIKSLNPEETIIFNILKKKLPFKGSNKLYNTEKKNLFNLDSYSEIIQYLEGISAKVPTCKNIIIDDATYIMRKEYFKSAKISGYNKFIDMASHFQSIIQTAENMREDINLFIIMHCEEIMSDNTIIGYKPSTVGKLIDSSYNPTEVVPMLLFANTKYDENKKPIYGFHTQKCLEGLIEIPAKSPEGMFEEDYIPNDLQYVVDKMNEFYN